MSMVTTSIHEVFNQVSSAGKPTFERIDETRKFIFNFYYPWYDSKGTGRDEFERLFIEHFFLNEIAFETLELFRLKLHERLSIRMPYYAQLYKSQMLEYDPFITYEEQANNTVTAEHNAEETQDIGKQSEETHNSESSGNMEESATTTGETSNTNVRDYNHAEESNVTASENGTSSGQSGNTTTDSGEEKVQSSGTGKTDTSDEQTTSSSSHTESADTSDNQSIHSDNPQVNFAGHDYAQYMDRGQVNETKTDESTASGSSGGSKTEEFTNSSNSTLTKSNTHTSEGTSSGTTGKTSESKDEMNNAGMVNDEGKGKSSGTEEKTGTNRSMSESNTSAKVTSESNGTKKEQSEETGHSSKKGFSADRSSLLLTYRSTFLNLNEMLIHECEDLFLQIYRSGYEAAYGGDSWYGLFW